MNMSIDMFIIHHIFRPFVALASLVPYIIRDDKAGLRCMDCGTKTIVAPEPTVNTMPFYMVSVIYANELKHISPKIRSIFKGRRKAAAWIVSHCNADSLRDEYLTRLQQHLFHYSLTLDVYGQCTGTKCENNDCEKMLRDNYYFYMAFENSFSEDYVTEKVLHGYDNYVVPIVYGAANYSR